MDNDSAVLALISSLGLVHMYIVVDRIIHDDFVEHLSDLN